MLRSLALTCCLCSLAVAQPKKDAKASSMKLTGDKAKVLIRALKLAGVAPMTKDRTFTYAAKTLFCRYNPDPPGGYVDAGDGLGTVACQIDDKDLSVAASAALLQGMHDAELPEPYYMGEKQIKATAVTCVDEQTKRSAAGPWSCSLTGTSR